MHFPYVISQFPYGFIYREGTTCKSLLIEPYGNCEMIYGKCIGLYLGSIWALYGNCENIGSGNARGASGPRGSQQKDPSAHLPAGFSHRRRQRSTRREARPHGGRAPREARRQARQKRRGRRATCARFATCETHGAARAARAGTHTDVKECLVRSVRQAHQAPHASSTLDAPGTPSALRAPNAPVRQEQ